MSLVITVSDKNGATSFDVTDAVETAMSEYRAVLNGGLPPADQLTDNAALIQKLLREAIPRLYALLNRPLPESPAVAALKEQLRIAQASELLLRRRP